MQRAKKGNRNALTDAAHCVVSSRKSTLRDWQMNQARKFRILATSVFLVAIAVAGYLLTARLMDKEAGAEKKENVERAAKAICSLLCNSR